MKINELAKKAGFAEINLADPDAEESGVYCGDLLSWVMGRAEIGNVWLTIMSNLNVAAVSVMADLSCVILCENVKPDENLLQKALEENVNIFSSEYSVYETAVKINKILNE